MREVLNNAHVLRLCEFVSSGQRPIYNDMIIQYTLVLNGVAVKVSTFSILGSKSLFVQPNFLFDLQPTAHAKIRFKNALVICFRFRLAQKSGSFQPNIRNMQLISSTLRFDLTTFGL